MSSSTRASRAGRRPTTSASRRPRSRSTGWKRISASNWSIARKRPFVLTPEGAGLLRGLPRGARTVRLGRGPGPLAAHGDQRPGPRGGDLFGRPARHEPLHAGLHAAAIPRPRCGWSICGPNKVYDAVLNAEVDLGIVSYPAASPDLSVIPCGRERMVLVCHPEPPAGRPRTR